MPRTATDYLHLVLTENRRAAERRAELVPRAHAKHGACAQCGGGGSEGSKRYSGPGGARRPVGRRSGARRYAFLEAPSVCKISAVDEHADEQFRELLGCVEAAINHYTTLLTNFSVDSGGSAVPPPEELPARLALTWAAAIMEILVYRLAEITLAFKQNKAQVPPWPDLESDTGHVAGDKFWAKSENPILLAGKKYPLLLSTNKNNTDIANGGIPLGEDLHAFYKALASVFAVGTEATPFTKIKESWFSFLTTQARAGVCDALAAARAKASAVVGVILTEWQEDHPGLTPQPNDLSQFSFLYSKTGVCLTLCTFPDNMPVTNTLPQVLSGLPLACNSSAPAKVAESCTHWLQPIDWLEVLCGDAPVPPPSGECECDTCCAACNCPCPEPPPPCPECECECTLGVGLIDPPYVKNPGWPAITWPTFPGPPEDEPGESSHIQPTEWAWNPLRLPPDKPKGDTKDKLRPPYRPLPWPWWS